MCLFKKYKKPLALPHDADAYEVFIHAYVKHPVIADRGEVDSSLCEKMSAKQLDEVKKIIAQEIKEIPHLRYLRVIYEQEFKEFIPELQKIVRDLEESLTQENSRWAEKLYAAMTLYAWGEYDDYPLVIEKVCKTIKDRQDAYLYWRYNYDMYIKVLPADEREKTLNQLN